MNTKDTGGSAFGIRTLKQQAESVEIDGGLSIRDYFAAKAPIEIPQWFKPNLPNVNELTQHLRKAIIDDHIKNSRLRKGIQDWRRDPCFDLESIGEDEDERAFLRSYEAAFDEYGEACAKARSGIDEQRYFAWRFHYADAMISERNKP